MSGDEKRVGASLASIFALRMLGLFLILPVFAEHAKHIPGGDNLTLVGIALGAYGLTQAIFQIPFGMASDAFGRKPVIIFGLLLFAAGSALAAWAPDIWWSIAGRIVQGAGAI
ncbi:MAG TPA: MFS transporter, partial [Rhodocyclaceae bacterium]|nr:MFS transporter [Rhodocyclaceae bacterium]